MGTSAERVQKILAQAGIASRRKAEELIIEGSVTINGKLAKLGDKAEWGKDAIKVNGKLLQRPETRVYIAFHKPKGVISTFTDPQERPCLSDYLSDIRYRIFPIGRLDFNSEGLIILTNDGELAAQIREFKDLNRVYEVKVKGHPAEDVIERMKKGVWIEVPVWTHPSSRPEPGTAPKASPQKSPFGRARKKMTKPLSVTVIDSRQSKSVLEIVAQGGDAFDVKGLVEAVGLRVERVVRTSIGTIGIEDLAPGQYCYLKPAQVEKLMRPAPERDEPVKPRVVRKIAPKVASKVTPIITPKGTSRGTPKIGPKIGPRMRPRATSTRRLPSR